MIVVELVLAVVKLVLVMLFYSVLVVASLLVIWTAVAALNRVIPDGEIKTFLFRVRGDESETLTPGHERLAVKAVVISLFSGLILFISWLSGR